MGRWLGTWENTAHRVLHRFRLDRIRVKILVFAVLATLVPSVTMSWHSYWRNREYVNEKISEELRNASTQTAREFNLWLKERFYETRVFSSSYEITENLELFARARAPGRPSAEPVRRLAAYLASVRAKFADYDQIAVLDLGGQSLVPGDPNVAARLPSDWVKQVRADANVVSEAYRDDGKNKPVMLIAVPIKAANGRLLGAMAGKLNFDSVEKILKDFSIGQTGNVHLIDKTGRVIVSSRPSGGAAVAARLPAPATNSLLARSETTVAYSNDRGAAVVGTLRPVSALGWAVVAEVTRHEVYGRVSRERNVMFFVLAGVVILVGLAAYVLALTVVRPLDRLTAGAKRVGAGNFDVELPVLDYGEVGYLTRAFNTMVSRLRDMNEELKTLSITDGLTGLFTQKHLLDTLGTELARAQRFKHPLAVLMIDVDHFKQYNDGFGHQQGDRLLIDMTQLFKSATRSIDYAARYGGDEFVLVLHEVSPADAVQLAERVRKGVAAATFHPRHKVTISVGVAGFPDHGATAPSLIAAADAALYEAKRQGRNKTVVARGETTSHRGR